MSWDEMHGTYEYPDRYSVYDSVITKGNKISKDTEPIGRIKARTATGWRSHRIVYNGIITNNKVMTATIETNSKLKIKADMYLKSSNGQLFKVEEATLVPDIDEQMYGKVNGGIQTIIISAADD